MLAINTPVVDPDGRRQALTKTCGQSRKAAIFFWTRSCCNSNANSAAGIGLNWVGWVLTEEVVDVLVATEFRVSQWARSLVECNLQE
jgi:hypothetical protein